MHLLRAIAGMALLGTTTSTSSDLPSAIPNENRIPAGTLRDGVLTLNLEAKTSNWYPNGDSLPGFPLQAFAESGRAPEIPGPLIRVPVGSEIRTTIKNTFERDTLTFLVPAAVSGRAGAASDSIRIPPGASGELRFKAAVPGNFLYRGLTGQPGDRITRMSGLLAGAIVVDSTPAPAKDRVFVLLAYMDSVTLDADGLPRIGSLVFGINGRSWPRTERLTATVGDTLRWRIINANFDVHPMHLHGFYYRVDDFTGPLAGGVPFPPGLAGRMVVTERMSGFTTMSMTWIPERGGNWLFHCHFSLHLATASSGTGSSHENHALQGMSGLVLGVAVSPRKGQRIAEPPRGRRQLRLLAIRDSAFPDSLPSMRFVVEDRARPGRRLEAGPGMSPTLELTRGEPVSITVVNQIGEPTAVHWHGIELESYHDGVAGYGGYGKRVSPIIAVRDSFEARFTPPRAGTFIYHSHIDEPRQHRAGLAGALIVRDAAVTDSTDERVVFLKASTGRVPTPIEINGIANPDTMVLRAGRPVRFRFISVAVVNPNATVSLTTRPDSSLANLRDTLIVQWKPVAKDGADLPELARIPRLARQIVGMGETYDFEFTPRAPGHLRIEVRGAGAAGRLLARTPIRVE
jgi:manganese oxidase